jgi:hypothetical protein
MSSKYLNLNTPAAAMQIPQLDFRILNQILIYLEVLIKLGDPNLISILKAWVGMVLLADSDQFHVSPIVDPYLVALHYSDSVKAGKEKKWPLTKLVTIMSSSLTDNTHVLSSTITFVISKPTLPVVRGKVV